MVASPFASDRTTTFDEAKMTGSGWSDRKCLQSKLLASSRKANADGCNVNPIDVFFNVSFVTGLCDE